MKLIAAIIQPHKLDEVKSALVNLGNFAITSTEVWHSLKPVDTVQSKVDFPQ